MDLTVPVKLKNVPMEFEEYCGAIRTEQASSLEYLASFGDKWRVPDSLKAKVNENGILKPFYGDTLTIPIERKDFRGMEEIQRYLHENNEKVFAEPLLPEYFHITLHDLGNSPKIAPIEEQMENNRKKCVEIFKELTAYLEERPELQKVSLESVFAYPCVNTSVVLGFAPATARDFRTIMNLYNLFDDVVYLDYWLRMHLTLAYFLPYEFSESRRKKLHETLTSISEKKVRITLDLWKIAYQRFSSMNHYETFFMLGNYR